MRFVFAAVLVEAGVALDDGCLCGRGRVQRPNVVDASRGNVNERGSLRRDGTPSAKLNFMNPTLG